MQNLDHLLSGRLLMAFCKEFGANAKACSSDGEGTVV